MVHCLGWEIIWTIHTAADCQWADCASMNGAAPYILAILGLHLEGVGFVCY